MQYYAKRYSQRVGNPRRRRYDTDQVPLRTDHGSACPGCTRPAARSEIMECCYAGPFHIEDLGALKETK